LTSHFEILINKDVFGRYINAIDWKRYFGHRDRKLWRRCDAIAGAAAWVPLRNDCIKLTYFPVAAGHPGRYGGRGPYRRSERYPPMINGFACVS
jgi:hypothetical protein